MAKGIIKLGTDRRGNYQRDIGWEEKASGRLTSIGSTSTRTVSSLVLQVMKCAPASASSSCFLGISRNSLGNSCRNPFSYPSPPDDRSFDSRHLPFMVLLLWMPRQLIQQALK